MPEGHQQSGLGAEPCWQGGQRAWQSRQRRQPRQRTERLPPHPVQLGLGARLGQRPARLGQCLLRRGGCPRRRRGVRLLVESQLRGSACRLVGALRARASLVRREGGLSRLHLCLRYLRACRARGEGAAPRLVRPKVGHQLRKLAKVELAIGVGVILAHDRRGLHAVRLHAEVIQRILQLADADVTGTVLIEGLEGRLEHPGQRLRVGEQLLSRSVLARPLLDRERRRLALHVELPLRLELRRDLHVHGRERDGFGQPQFEQHEHGRAAHIDRPRAPGSARAPGYPLNLELPGSGE